jgi:hypothetical protein
VSTTEGKCQQLAGLYPPIPTYNFQIRHFIICIQCFITFPHLLHHFPSPLSSHVCHSSSLMKGIHHKMRQSLVHSPPDMISYSEGAFDMFPSSRNFSQPPVDVVVVKEMAFPPTSPARRVAPSLSSSPPTSTLFRLKPRHDIKCTSASRGRKRPAASISATIFSTTSSFSSRDGEVQNSTITVTQDEATTSSFPLNDPSANSLQSPGGMSDAVAILQTLSLSSPSHPPASVATSDGTSPQLSLVGQYHPPRSSFSKYSAHSQAGIRRLPQVFAPGATPLRHPSAMSSPAGSARSSPRIAPLTVLSHDESRPHLQVVGMMVGSFTTLAPLSQVNSGVDCREDDLVINTPLLPPSTVHCTTRRNSESSTSDSFSTINGEDDDDTPTFNNKACTRTRRELLFADASPSRRSVASNMSERTPLPTVALTPRSHGNRSSRLPQFPSLTNDNDDFEFASPFLATPTLSIGKCSGEVNLEHFGFYSKKSVEPRSLFVPSSADGKEPTRDKKMESFIPLPDWGESSPSDEKEETPAPSQHSKCRSHMSGSSSSGMRSRSLLKPSTSNSSMLELLARSPHITEPFGENESLCTSDDEDAFFLVPPSAIVAERNDNQHRAKQRRLYSSTTPNESSKGRLSAGSPSAQASSSSLRGMGFVLSSGSLQDDSSIGLALEPSATTEEDLTVTGRDLVTPPIMQQASSPPPLPLCPGFSPRKPGE